MIRRKLMLEKKLRHENSVMGSAGGSVMGYPNSSTAGIGRFAACWPSWKASAGSLSSTSGTARGNSRRFLIGGGAASSSLSCSGSTKAGTCLLLLLQNAKKLWELSMKAEILGVDLPHFITICLAINHFVDFLVSKQLQD
jgi:hypothetical protein